MSVYILNYFRYFEGEQTRGTLLMDLRYKGQEGQRCMKACTGKASRDRQGKHIYAWMQRRSARS